MIKLTITKEVPNEQFAQQMEDYNRNNRSGFHNNGYERPQETKVANILEVMLTEDEYKMIKREIIDIF